MKFLCSLLWILTMSWSSSIRIGRFYHCMICHMEVPLHFGDRHLLFLLGVGCALVLVTASCHLLPRIEQLWIYHIQTFHNKQYPNKDPDPPPLAGSRDPCLGYSGHSTWNHLSPSHLLMPNIASTSTLAYPTTEHKMSTMPAGGHQLVQNSLVSGLTKPQNDSLWWINASHEACRSLIQAHRYIHTYTHHLEMREFLVCKL